MILSIPNDVAVEDAEAALRGIGLTLTGDTVDLWPLHGLVYCASHITVEDKACSIVGCIKPAVVDIRGQCYCADHYL